MSRGPWKRTELDKSRAEERYNLYLQYIRRGKFHSEACRLAKVKPEKVRLRQQTNPQFRQDLLEAHAEFSEKVESVLTDAAFGVVHYAVDADGKELYNNQGERVVAQRDTKAALEWLKARNSSIFSPARQVDVSINQNVSLDFTDFHSIKAELEARRPAEIGPGMIEDAEILYDD